MVDQVAPTAVTQPRTIRVFVSSTFPPSLQLRRTGRDTQTERDVLIKEIFPQLHKLGKERAVSWTEVDLRWGVRDEAALDQQTMRISQEIRPILDAW